MSNPAIKVEGLGKEYIIGGAEFMATTFREMLTDAFTAPFKRFSKLSGKASEAELFWALKDVSFNIQQGEVVGIIGRNGAGKSTLLKILCRITAPTRGRIELEGRVASLLEVGTGFHPELTGRENIYLNGAILGMKQAEIKKKFDDIVNFAEIEKFLDTPVKRYSSGMYVRLAFAVAAHLEPEILLVDEVLAVGDIAFQKKCLGKMESVAGQGRTVLFVSHNMAAIQSLCRRVIVLDGGQIQNDGEAEKGIQFYLSVISKDSSRGRYSLGKLNEVKDLPAFISSAQITSNGQYLPEGYSIGAPLEITVDCNTNETIRNPLLGIGIDNSVGVRVVTFHTRHSNLAEKDDSYNGKFRFVCKVDDLALAPGDYFVKFSLETMGGHQPAHVINSAFSFSIIETDFYGSARHHNAGVILCRDSWERGSITE